MMAEEPRPTRLRPIITPAGTVQAKPAEPPRARAAMSPCRSGDEASRPRRAGEGERISRSQQTSACEHRDNHPLPQSASLQRPETRRLKSRLVAPAASLERLSQMRPTECKENRPSETGESSPKAMIRHAAALFVREFRDQATTGRQTTWSKKTIIPSIASTQAPALARRPVQWRDSCRNPAPATGKHAGPTQTSAHREKTNRWPSTSCCSKPGRSQRTKSRRKNRSHHDIFARRATATKSEGTDFSDE